MLTGRFNTPLPTNEPVYGYAPGSPRTCKMEAELTARKAQVVEIPCVVGGKRIFTGRTVEVTMPCDHGHVLAIAHLATPEVVEQAIENALSARQAWSELPWSERVAIFLRAAELLRTTWRQRLECHHNALPSQNLSSSGD